MLLFVRVIREQHNMIRLIPGRLPTVARLLHSKLLKSICE